ncbi:MAG: thioredoxin family protein [Anaerolineales bacterium]|nr:thioredoxin family protein [Anaerolineales bacterium]
MVEIKILGSGCPNCKRLQQYAASAAERVREEQDGFDFEIGKITDPGQFLEYGLLSTPGLVINGKLVSSGRIPSEEEIMPWLLDALEA